MKAELMPKRAIRSVLLSILFVTLVGASAALAAEMGETSLGTGMMTGLKAVGAGLALLGGTIGAGYALGATGAAGIAVISEKPEEFGRVLLFIGIAETPAIYGIAIAIVILFAI
ncbi:ATP synthase subunit C [Ignicoccus hospitalis]|uniref:H+-transporting two-sector ATPase, C subunit n=1 Tax=Ignicoccus hospitalis (strain KIN4/I / DSM 18386 / JCM 14125) TaxID=453591 RepID=A8AAB2_IGNH4|nr:ATP synthase subunit C [Ignicoccus hospitalis]ABU81864.1 H+-transporting two-sector ATPase, C subunit [Ignicoccus hospitalis KIN4/I]HIH90132.1 V-type ATP synthase subunit K [Desulfurococcaceae archaeon]